MSDLQTRLAEKLRDDGWQVSARGAEVSASREVILSKWLLGSRRVRLTLGTRFDDAARIVHYRETAKEVSIGLPPPTLSLTTTRQRGLEVQESRRDVSVPGGGGNMAYGETRQWLQSCCEAAGWRLELELLSFSDTD